MISSQKILFSLALVVLFALAIVTLSVSLLPGSPIGGASLRVLLEEEDDGDVSGGGICTSDADCGGPDQGTCSIPTNSTSGTCTCSVEYADSNCTYQRKKALTAFLLGFLVGTWGADRFYLGYIGLGVVKLLLTLANCILSIVIRVVRNFMDQESGKATALSLGGGVASCCLALGVLAWWITDWALIIANKLPDAKGYALWDNL